MAVLDARLREGTGKGAARKLRSKGEVPAVAYGHGQDSRPLAVNAHELQMLLATINRENTIIELRVENAGPVQALIREVQRHPSRPYIQHVDFFQVRAGEKIHVEIPIRLHGIPIGVREGGGVLQEVLREIAVACLPKDIPAAIDIDIVGLGLGDTVHVSDVQLPNVTILNDPELVICSVAIPSAVVLPEDGGAAAEGEAETTREAGGEG